MNKLIALSLILVMALIACNMPSQQQEPQKIEPTKSPVPMVIKEWTGTGSKTTEPFVIDGDYWAIAWAFQPKPVAGIYANLLTIEVRKPNTSLYFELPVNIANTRQLVGDNSFIYDGGTFYLDISSMSGTWSIQVIDFR